MQTGDPNVDPPEDDNMELMNYWTNLTAFGVKIQTKDIQQKYILSKKEEEVTNTLVKERVNWTRLVVVVGLWTQVVLRRRQWNKGGRYSYQNIWLCPRLET